MCKINIKKEWVSVEEVLRHFFKIEKLKSQNSSIDKCLNLNSTDFIECVRKISEDRPDINPVLVWTIGIKNNKHYEKIKRWFLADVEINCLNCLYSKGVNEKVNKDLIDKSHGNILDFTNNYASNHSEFNSNDICNDELKILIGIKHTNNNFNGNIELIDGIHRLVTIIRSGDSYIRAYIGELIS